jgi:uncharacterized YigZ family protein
MIGLADGILIILMFSSRVNSFHSNPCIIQPSVTKTMSILRNRIRMLSSSPLPWITLEEGSHSSELIVKKSQFLGYAKHAETWKEAQQYLEEVRLEHPKARHICFGFVAGINPLIERCSDGGEPTGTAGSPILGAIQGERLTDTMCIVVRYFGGIKLGAGGLIRAYGGGARQVLRAAPKKIVIPRTTFRVIVPSHFIGQLYDSISKAGADASDEEYDVYGKLSLSITVETERESILRSSLTDSTRGEITFP